MGELAHHKPFTWEEWCALIGRDSKKPFLDMRTDQCIILEESHIGRIVFRYSNEFPGTYLCGWDMYTDVDDIVEGNKEVYS
jgi:hypothetical protein